MFLYTITRIKTSKITAKKIEQRPTHHTQVRVEIVSGGHDTRFDYKTFVSGRLAGTCKNPPTKVDGFVSSPNKIAVFFLL